MTKEQNNKVLISKENIHRLISFIARIDQSRYDFDIINKADYNPDFHHKASPAMLENYFPNSEQLISMLTDDAIVVYIVSQKEGTEILEELDKTIEFLREKINNANISLNDIIEYAKILVMLRDTINQSIEK